MRSLVQLDIDLSKPELAELFADPALMTKWMDDLERVEPISGKLGVPGSRYRLIPKSGDMVFEATVIARNLPHESRLRLEASNVTVAISATFEAVSPGTTRLVSDEQFTFKGVFGKLLGFFAQWSIRKAHRRHMLAFKHFAESNRQGTGQ